MDVTAGGIFLYKSPNQAFQFLEDKVLFNLEWSTRSQIKHHQIFVAFADGSNNDNDNSRLMGKLEALTIKMDSQFQSLKEEMHEMRKNYNNLRNNSASKNNMNDDTPMYERHEAITSDMKVIKTEILMIRISTNPIMILMIPRNRSQN
ncbi:hypothetical protein Tco_0379773 [Tanacetum coccineum]